jgi:CheY-like chemotaxis protein
MKKISSKSDLIARGMPPARSSVAPSGDRRELLLYVEDDDDNWHVAELRLGKLYQIHRASSSKQACELLRDKGPVFSAILMDIELKGSDLDGVGLTEVIRGKGAIRGAPSYTAQVPVLDTPIIFVTAHNAKYSDTMLVLAGGDKVIPKPVDFGALNTALTQLYLSRAGRRR